MCLVPSSAPLIPLGLFLTSFFNTVLPTKRNLLTRFCHTQVEINHFLPTVWYKTLTKKSSWILRTSDQLNCKIVQNSWIWRLDSLLVVALAVTTLSWVWFVKGALGRNPRYFVYSSMRIAFAVLFWAFHSIQTFELLNFVENDILSLNKLPDLLIAVLGSNSSPDTGTSSHPCGSSMS